MAVLRSTPEDFVVDEIPLYAASGEGGHTFVLIEKRLRNTEEVARALAHAAGVSPRDVGYAGRKDRVAVTRQRFSVPDFAPERALAFEMPGVRVLEAVRHPHKLRTGQLLGNRFEIVVRDVDDALAAQVAARLEHGLRRGLPNRFGEQRFGRDGDNAATGLALLRGDNAATRLALPGGDNAAPGLGLPGGDAGGTRPRGRPLDRRALRFAVSALQAAVFNEALRRRTVPLDALEAGDLAQVHASGGVFLVEDVSVEGPRALRGEVSATGPIFGTKTLAPTGAPAAREREALASVGLDPDAALPSVPGLRLRGSRRALRMLPTEASVVREGDTLRLRFTLPAGSYATVLLDELFGGPARPAGEATPPTPCMTPPGPKR